MIAAAVIKATPILFCALAFLLASRAGVLNIGADGQLLVGALAAAAVGTTAKLPPTLATAAALAAGAAAGAAWAGLAAWLAEKRRVLDVLGTLLLNFIASGLVSLAVHSFLQERARTFPQSEAVPDSVRLATIPGTGHVHAGVFIALLVAFGIQALLDRTRFGFRLRASGSGAEAAAYAGIRVSRVRAIAFATSGAIAGLGGAVELLGVTGRLFESFSPGFGFVGLAAAVVGALNPLGAIAAALAFGALAASGSLLQRRAGVPWAVVLVLQGLILIAALLVQQIRARRLRISA